MSTEPPFPPRPIRSAELFAVGSELTAGETRDTNGGELARALAGAGVGVRRIVALPDDLELVTMAFAEALAAVDLVVTTGGLGPTPDDLTREAIAAAIGEQPAVDDRLERWLRAMFARRKVELPEMNLKQAWLIPSATSIPNANGTAPGWWVDRPDGRVVVLLPGPPREMRPMWHSWVEPRLRERGLGDGREVRVLRTYGIGESAVAERLGDAMLRHPNPVVATYARSDWLDIRISAVDESPPAGGPSPASLRTDGRSAAEILDATEAAIRELLPGFVWAQGETSWADLVEQAAERAGVRFAVVEAGAHGALGALLAGVPALERAVAVGPAASLDPEAAPVEEMAADAARSAGVEVGVALVARTTATETPLRIGVAHPGRSFGRVQELRLFQHGDHGRFRAGVAAAAFLVQCLAELAGDGGAAPPRS